VRRAELEHGRWGVDFERDALGLEVARRLAGGVVSRWDRDAVGRPLRRTFCKLATAGGWKWHRR
ncbi:MAG: hypothetical protein KF729_39140, partial [Sandaracinaceae bacterium]|nr:hypothetical protein [Sandaracinaceae bacterium]